MDLLAALDAYAPRPGGEAADAERVRALATTADPWARHSPVHVTGSAFVVDPPSRRVRYVLSTGRPDAIVPESPAAPLRWLPIDEAIAAVSEDNVREALRRVRALLGATGSDELSTSTSR